MTVTTTGLETGWRPDTPVDDTLLRHATHGLAASWASIAEHQGGRVEVDHRFVAADLTRPAAMFNSVTLLRPLHGEALATALDDIERSYDHHGAGDVSLWSPWPTPDLSGRGWQLEGHPPLLARPAGPPPDVAIPDELRIAEVTDRAGVDEFCAVSVDGFPFEELKPYRPGSLLDERLLGDERFRLLVGRVDGRAVCAGAQFVHRGLNWLFLAVTRPEARGNGYYKAMAAQRLADRPDLPAVAVVSDDSRPALVSRFGFWPITRLTLWTRSRA